MSSSPGYHSHIANAGKEFVSFGKAKKKEKEKKNSSKEIIDAACVLPLFLLDYGNRVAKKVQYKRSKR